MQSERRKAPRGHGQGQPDSLTGFCRSSMIPIVIIKIVIMVIIVMIVIIEIIVIMLIVLVQAIISVKTEIVMSNNNVFNAFSRLIC